MWKLEVGVEELLTFSVDKKPFYHFPLLSLLNFMTLLIALMYDYDPPCTCLNNPLIVFFCLDWNLLRERWCFVLREPFQEQHHHN